MDDTSIPFNKPFVAGKELYYIAQSISFGNIAANGHFTTACNRLLYERFDLGNSLMATSCTSALEMAASLCDIEPGDEVILPSYTFVSTANAFVRAGATPVFVDIRTDTLNMDETLREQAITTRTKAIVPVHYAGVACEMDSIKGIAERHNVFVDEDATQGVHAYYRGKALGSIGHLGAYSYHETKNYICGEHGTLCINDAKFESRAEIIRDKGTNRQQFFRSAVDKYRWVDVGSSYVVSELSCAFLYAQLEALDAIRDQRRQVFDNYRQLFSELENDGHLRLPVIPAHCDTNYHMFSILLENQATRDSLMQYLREHGVNAAFHYIPLHTSPMGKTHGNQRGQLPVTEEYAGRLLRLPFFTELEFSDQERITGWIDSFLTQRSYRTVA